MKTRGLPFLLIALSGGLAALGQSLTDHAAAIAGASAGVAGGRVVSDALSRVLQSASDATGTAAAEPTNGKTGRGSKDNTPVLAGPWAGVPAGASAAPVFTPGDSGPAPQASAGHPSRGGSGPAPGQPVYYRAVSAEPSIASVTPAELRGVSPGTKRDDVIGKVGLPYAQITMDDDGHLVQILEYGANGNRVGSVRCSDGRVESVTAGDR